MAKGKHPLYNTWSKMKYRCYNPKAVNYDKYGGRGITVCKRWRDSFEAFVRDMGEKPTDRHTLDRINNDGNYSPKNCKWSTPEEQTYNQGLRRDNVSGHKGVTYCKRHKRWYVKYGSHKNRLSLGSSKSLEEAINIKINYINSLKNKKVL